MVNGKSFRKYSTSIKSIEFKGAVYGVSAEYNVPHAAIELKEQEQE